MSVSVRYGLRIFPLKQQIPHFANRHNLIVEQSINFPAKEINVNKKKLVWKYRNVNIPCSLHMSARHSEIRMLYLRIHGTKRLFHQILGKWGKNTAINQ